MFMTGVVESPTEELVTSAPQENLSDLFDPSGRRPWPQIAETLDIKLDIPENTAYEFAPPQVSVIPDGTLSNEVEADLSVDGEVFAQADQAFQRLSAKYKGGIRIGFPNNLNVEDIPEEDLSDLGTILSAWNKANETYFYLDSRPHQYFRSQIKEQWDDLAVEQTEHVRAILGIDFDTLAQDFFSASGDVPEGISTVQELIRSREFHEKANLTNYLIQEGWRAKRTFFRFDPKDGENYVRARYYYEYTKYEINQLLCEAALSFAEQGQSEQLGIILEHLSFSRIPEDPRFKPWDFPSSYEDAAGILLSENLTPGARQLVLKELVKVFGPISTVDTLAAKIHVLRDAGLTREDPYAKDLARLYSLIEGENVPDPMEKLGDVYEIVDYASLERPELSAKEADKIERVATLFAQGVEYSTVEGKVIKLNTRMKPEDPHQVTGIDIGAGNARVSRELFRRGYVNFFALDFDPKNVGYAMQRRPSEKFTVIRGDWHNLPFETADYTNTGSSLEVGFTTERSFLHNRRAPEWFELFDEFRRVSHYRAMLFMDLPDINNGIYKERIESFRTNIEKNLGIVGTESNIIFDGPGKVKFNRMAISEEQLGIYCHLFGFVIVDKEEDPRPENNMTDVYFTLAKDQNWLPGDITQSDLWNSLVKLGMFDYDVDYNMFVDSWGMTLGQALLFGLESTGSLHSLPRF